jgi:hypothetical protein
VYGRPAAPVDEEPMSAPPAARAAVPQQRATGVYGQRQATPDAPPSGWQEAPAQSAPQAQPGWDPRPEAAPGAWQQPGAAHPAEAPAPPPAQFEQHGRRTQGYSETPPPQRSGGWQDQLQPMQPIANPPVYSSPPPAQALPTPVDVSAMQAQPRNVLKIVGYITIVLLIIVAAAGALWYTSRPDLPTVGSCVQQSGDAPLEVPCSRSGAYRVTKSVSNVSDCPDYLNQPSLSYPSGGKLVILCLEPASGAAPTGGASVTPSPTPSPAAPAPASTGGASTGPSASAAPSDSPSA